MARDPLELRRHSATVPTDLNDPPRFSQLVETTKDAFVLELREYLRQSGFTTERRAELPLVEKYAVGFGAGLDPYETFVKIVQDFPDVTERMPHIAVTAASGGNNRFTFGRPFIAHTQAPPRVVTANAAPYALAAAAAQTTTISIVTLPAGVYTVTIAGNPYSTTALAPGTNATDTAAAIRDVLRAAVGLLFEVTSTAGAAAQVILRGRTVGESYTVSVSANLSFVTSAASAASAPDMLVYRTTPNGATAVTSLVVFQPSRFPTGTITAATAADVARVINEQALYAQARVVPVGVGSGVQLETGGPRGGSTPNEIEILSSTTDNVLAVLGLGNRGVVGAGASIGGEAPTMSLVVPGAGFTAAMIGRYVTIGGATTSTNNGRFRIVSFTSATTIGLDNVVGVAEALPVDATWFVGYRDDSKNNLRPVQNRYHMSAKLTVTIDILAESPNERRELLDLVYGFFTFFLEQKHFTLYGRGVFDETYGDEHYQMSVHQEVQASGDQDFPRGEDQKNRIYNTRMSVPVTITHYIDRAVLVPSGPRQGEGWTLESTDVAQDDSLPTKS